jgi:hypothetical protein
MPVPQLGMRSFFGKFFFDANDAGWFGSRTGTVPALVLATALLPVVLGSFTGFRCCLWHYFAWTTLVAAELAYYRII